MGSADVPELGMPPPPTLLPPLRHSTGFWVLWAGQVVSQAGTAIFTVALLWTASRQGRSDAALAGLSLTVPSCLGLIGGVVADRLGRLTTLYLTDGIRALVLGGTLVLLARSNLPLPLLLTVSVLLAAGGALFSPAQMALMPDLVAERDLPGANGLEMAGTQVGSLVGYLAGGVLVATGGLRLPVLTDAVSYTVSVLSLLWVQQTLHKHAVASGRHTTRGRRTRSHAVGRSRSLWDDVQEGLGYVWRDPAIRALVPLALVTNLLFAPMVSGLVIVARVMHLLPEGYAILETSWALGALAGGALAQRLFRAVRATLLIGPLMVLGGSALIVAGLVLVSPYTQVGIGIGSAMNGLANAALLTWLQAKTPEHLRGRVFGFVLTALTISVSVGLGLYGAVAGLLPGGAAPMLAGLSLGVFGTMAWLPTPVRRSMTEGLEAHVRRPALAREPGA